MAKKATKTTNEEIKVKKKSLEELIVPADAFISRPKQIINVTPTIDIGLGGGIPEGSVVILTGPAKCGKTTTALKIAQNARNEKFYINGKRRKVFFYNVEGRLKDRDLTAVFPGLEDIYVVGSEEGNILSGQEFLTILENNIRQYPGSVHIFDSFSQICTQEEAIAGMDEMQRADGAKLLKKFFRRNCNVIPVNNCILIGITHLMGNPSGHGGDGEGGGYAAKYAVDVKLRCTYTERWTIGANDDSEQIGQKIHWRVECSSLGPTGRKLTSYLRYGESLDDIMELIELAVDIDIIKQSGAWYKVDINGTGNEEDLKNINGKENLREFLKANPSVKQNIEKQTYDMMGLTV